MKKFIYILLLIFSLTTLVGCNEEEGTPEETKPAYTEEQLNAIVFESKTFTYDGVGHSLYVMNLPIGLNVEYFGNDQREVGEYRVIAMIEDQNGNLILTLGADLIIKPIGSTTQPHEHNFVDGKCECGEEDPNYQTPQPGVIDLSKVKFTSVTVKYDGEKHSIYLENVPTGVTVTYGGNEVSEKGVHKVVAKVYDSNQNLLDQFEATISIVTGSDVELPLV